MIMHKMTMLLLRKYIQRFVLGNGYLASQAYQKTGGFRKFSVAEMCILMGDKAGTCERIRNK